MHKRFPCVAAVLLLAGVLAALQPLSVAQNAPAYKTSGACSLQLANLGELKQQIKRYYACTCDCGCYEREAAAQGARAMRFLRQRTARSRGQKLALVLDIDDTALSNYPLYSSNDFSYVPAEYDRWLAGATAPAVRPTLALFQAARELGVAVFFISGRREDQRAATEQNLRSAGFTGWAGLTLRGPEDRGKKAAEYKAAARQKIVAEGYRLLLNVGDQRSDLTGAPLAEHSIKMPNPMYFIP